MIGCGTRVFLGVREGKSPTDVVREKAKLND
jgi:hypothetical protein